VSSLLAPYYKTPLSTCLLASLLQHTRTNRGWGNLFLASKVDRENQNLYIGMQSAFFCFNGRFSYFRKSIFLFQKIFVKDTLVPSTKDTSTPSNESCPFKLTNTCFALCQRISRIDTVEVGAIRTATMCSIRTKRVDTNLSLRLYQETRRAVRSTSVSCAIASCMPTLEIHSHCQTNDHIDRVKDVQALQSHTPLWCGARHCKSGLTSWGLGRGSRPCIASCTGA
jgi:hypothetical protein